MVKTITQTVTIMSKFLFLYILGQKAEPFRVRLPDGEAGLNNGRSALRHCSGLSPEPSRMGSVLRPRNFLFQLGWASFILVNLIFWQVNQAWAVEKDLKLIEAGSDKAATVPVAVSSNTAATEPDIAEISQEQVESMTKAGGTYSNSNAFSDPTNYTLGPDDVIEVNVMRHPEFSGKFPVNLEGKIQLKFAGDILVTGLTKTQLEQRLQKMLSSYVINPEVNVTIVEYKSKVIYIIGEVAKPGKYYIRSESIPVREAVVEAGLPTFSAAMRKCRLITPTDKGKPKTSTVDLYTILYDGNLKNNISMKPGDVFYVPATVMAKVIRVITPVTAPVTNAASAKSAVTGF